MLKRNIAFSLVELLLATAIMGIVLMSVYSSFSLAMRTWKRVKIRNDQNATQVLNSLTRQLRSAYLSLNGDPEFAFNGTLTSLRFTTTAEINDDIYVDSSSDLLKVSYAMSTDQNSGQRVLKYEVYDLLGENKKNFKQRILESTIQSISFAFFDGEKWQNGWDSMKKLPQAVKIIANFKEGAYKNSYETVAVINCANNNLKDEL